MKQNKLKSSIRKFTPQKRRAVAEVISSLLLVVITVAGAVILMTFLDESFISGSLAVSSGTDSSLKMVKLRAFDTRDGADLFGYTTLDNIVDPVATPLLLDGFLCRDGFDSGCAPLANKSPDNFGTQYVVIQIQTRGLNPIWLSDVYFDNVGHVWDSTTGGVPLDGSFDPSLAPSSVPHDGMFSILPVNSDIQQIDNQIKEGQAVNVVVKLDSINPDIPLSKTIRVQLNIGTSVLQEFLIESGGAQ